MMKIFSQNNKNHGFAIGLILLAVVLIAAIVAAIATSTGDSAASGDREQARVNASTLIQQAIAIENGIRRFDALGGGTISDGKVADAEFIGNAAEATMGSAPDPSRVDNNIPTGGANDNWQVVTVAGETWIFLNAVPAGNTNLCDQINSILYNTTPQLGAAAFSNTAPVAITIDGTARTEGCDNGGGGAATTATYFKQVI